MGCLKENKKNCAGCIFHTGFQCLKALTRLDWSEFAKNAGDELFKISTHAALPAMLCTFNIVCGLHAALSVWLMSVVAGYVIHKKRRELDEATGYCSFTLSGRYLVWALCAPLVCFLSPVTRLPEGFGDFEMIGLWVIVHLITFISHIVLYRFYFTIYSNLTPTIAKFKKSLLKELDEKESDDKRMKVVEEEKDKTIVENIEKKND